jgi:hypothetical protein
VLIAKGDGHESSGVKTIEVQRKREKPSSTKSSRKDMERSRNDKYQTSVRRVEAIASGSTRLTENSQWCYEVQEVAVLQLKS